MMYKLLNLLVCLALLFSLSICCSGYSLAQSDEENIKIASIFSKTGDAATSNFLIMQAVRLAVDEINSSGGVLGKKIQLLEYDNSSSPIKSKLMARRAAKDGVLAVIGASWSDHSLAMAPVLQKAGIPMISPSSTNPKLTLIGDYIFRGCFTDTFQGKVLARFAVDEFKAKTAAVLVNITSSYSLGLAKSFTERFTELGGKILAEEDYKDGERNFSSILARIKEVNPDILLLPGYDECGYIVKQAQDIGLNSVLLGGDGWGIKQFLANGGQELKQGYYTSHWSQYLDRPETKSFVERYQPHYTLDETSALGYDSVMLLADAIRRAGKPDQKAIRDALAATTDFHGVSGTFGFDQNGDAVKGVNIMEIVEGKPKYYKTIAR